ncbi:MAG: DegV family protein [Clostridiales bacterium]|jgi:DegV family protein with EDD domain|nr:DegV family protein [Clostridiales bacterium]
MGKIIITGDSSWDMPRELLGAELVSIPLCIILGDKEYLDGVSLTNDDIYAYAESSGKTPKTAATPPAAYEEVFAKQFAAGADGIVHIALSSGVSACHDNAAEAAKKFKNVYVVDSKSLSSGSALVALYARDLAGEGLLAAEIAQKAEARRDKVQCSFVVDKLEFLHKGGRCSGLARFASTVLRIKPTILMNERMSVGKKYIGVHFKSALSKYADDTFERCPEPDLKRVFITYSVVEPDILDMVKEKVAGKFKFEEVYVNPAGSTVTSHCGKNTLGILFFNK